MRIAARPVRATRRGVVALPAVRAGDAARITMRHPDHRRANCRLCARRTPCSLSPRRNSCRMAGPRRGAAAFQMFVPIARRSAKRGLVSLVAAWIIALARLASATPISIAPDDAPHGQIRFRSFGPADGLRNLVVVSVVQDGNGLLWVATDDGVFRYDGQRFTHYTISDGIPGLAVNVLGVAPDGAVCAGTGTGLACWNGTRFSPAGAEGVPAEWVWALAAGPGALWAGTSTGLFVRRGSAGFVRAPGAPDRAVKAIWADADGVVIGDGATLQVSAGDGGWQVLGAAAGLDVERIDAVLRDHDGTLWIRSAHHLWTLRRGSTRVDDWSDGLATGADRSGVACGMAISAWGDVLVGTSHGIAYRRDGGWRMVDDSIGMPAREARALFVDREGTVWIGSVGLFQWMGRGLVTRHNLASGLPSDVVWSVARDRNNILWFGTGQCLARVVDDRWECLPASNGPSVRTFVFAPHGGMFLGGGAPDLTYIDPDGHRHMFELPGDRVPDRQLLALALGPEGDLWIATSAGLFRLRGALPGVPERVEGIPGGRDDTRYVSLLVSEDQLWVTGDIGLAVLDRGSWRVFDPTTGLRATATRHLIHRRDGRFCVSYSNADGVTCFQLDGGAITEPQEITLADGLTSGRIYFLGEDRQQRLWIGTGDGVDVMTATGIDHFDEADGLVGNDSAARSFFEDRDGSLWLGATNGVSHLRAQHYRGPPVAPRTTLLAGTLGGKPLSIVAGTAQAPHDLNAVDVSFAADGYLDPQRIEFQVRLSPIEPAWSTTRLREARYPALPPGSYRLEMRARTGAGAWGPAAALQLAILPAWWQTRWFLVLACAAILAVVAGAVTVLWRRRAHQLHQRSDASFRDLIESMPDLVLVYRDSKLIYLNEAARQMLGLGSAPDEWRGGNLSERVHPDDHAAAAGLFREASSVTPVNAPQAQVVEIRLAAGDGTWRNCELSGRRIELGDGPVTVMSGRDVTERHRLRAKLLLSDRMASLGTLAAGIAHEINNPLAYVTANLEVVAESLELEPARRAADYADRKAALADAREGAERVRKIVRGLRSFSRYEEEKRVALALPEVIDAAVRLTGNELKHRAMVVCELAPTPLVFADEGRLAQVLINLLINAAHAIPAGRTSDNRITVRTRTDDQGRAVLEVEDTGTGMPPDVQQRAFDPFFTTKPVGEGTGLGLSICHGIVTGLGGQITIESARVHGSIVRVALPPAPAEHLPASAVIADAAPAPPRRHRVMIVDDDPRVARALKRMLSVDHDLMLASCGAEAIEHVTAGARFDAIITDVMMPNMTGIELHERLADLAPDQALRMIFLTGGVFSAQTQAMLDAAGNPQLQKPVSSQQLRECVSSLVLRSVA
jgi:PAS domain S-box-containing protein